MVNPSRAGWTFLWRAPFHMLPGVDHLSLEFLHSLGISELPAQLPASSLDKAVHGLRADGPVLQLGFEIHVLGLDEQIEVQEVLSGGPPSGLRPVLNCVTAICIAGVNQRRSPDPGKQAKITLIYKVTILVRLAMQNIQSRNHILRPEAEDLLRWEITRPLACAGLLQKHALQVSRTGLESCGLT